MKKLWANLVEWFYRTKLGNWYLGFLLWVDKNNEPERVVPKHEVNQLMITAQQFAYKEGIRNIKKHVNSLVKAKTKDEYQAVLSQIEDLMRYAKSESEEKAKLTQALYNAWVFTGGRDIKNPTERAKMIDKRIKDYKELQEHTNKRKLIRQIRQARKEGDEAKAKELEKKWKEKYGKNSRGN